MIRGKHVALRTVRRGDLPAMREANNDMTERGAFWMAELRSEPAFEKRFEEDGFWSTDNGLLLIETPEGRVVGEIGFYKTVPYQEGFEIGYRIYRREDRGGGLMTEALRLFCAYLYDLKPITRLQVNVTAGNDASRAVAEKCGFTLDGTLRKFLFVGGRIHDAELFSLLRDECPPLADLIASV